MSSFQQLVDIVKKLRGPNGCPWDKAQTHESLTPYAIEEAHELEDAILSGDSQHVKEELGDLLFQSVLHAEIARAQGTFDIDDVINTLNEKMQRRHPHVFGDVKVENADQVMSNWEDIKAKEKNALKTTSEPFDIPKNFPALLRAHKIGKRSKKLDFDWDHASEVLDKVDEELAELKQAITNQSNIEEELGDLLFSLAQLARHLDLDSEKALRQANEKFIKRFQEMLEQDPDLLNKDRASKEKMWNLVKKK